MTYGESTKNAERLPDTANTSILAKNHHQFKEPRPDGQPRESKPKRVDQLPGGETMQLCNGPDDRFNPWMVEGCQSGQAGAYFPQQRR